jgi:hypothetical protein
VGEAKRKFKVFQASGAVCIFCGGGTPATTEEHCPPRGLFRDRQWPVGFVFPACQACNGGTRDQDLMVAFMAQLHPHQDGTISGQSEKLMRGVHKRFPGTLQEMVNVSAVSARATARKLRLEPARGQTYQGLGIANVPEAMHACVATLAGKLTKAIYHQQRGRIFPADGGITFQWFTNAQHMEHGCIPILQSLQGILGASKPIRRNGQDLRDQFDYEYSSSQAGDLHLLRVAFGSVFGFVTIFSQTPGRLEAIDDELKRQHAADASPVRFISTNRARGFTV